MVADEVIQSILASTPALDAAVKKLVDAANAAGGMDNVTVVLARYEAG
jgi:protein phosphatase